MKMFLMILLTSVFAISATITGSFTKKTLYKPTA